MSATTNSQARSNALAAIKSYRVTELQALLECGNLSRQGNKRDLLQRCRSLIVTNFTLQLANKIQQINNTRTRPAKSSHVSSSTSSPSSRSRPIVLPKTPPVEVLPSANHIQFINLPFYEKMRTIECSNLPVDWHTFSPLRFALNETDVDLIRKNMAKIFIRIAPTVVVEKHNDVMPPYLYVQCNNQPVINNNITKQVGSQAHSTCFPTDITDKLILKPNASNTLTYVWLHSPTTMSLKNLPKAYTISIQLVHCVSINTLFELILKREPYTNKTDDDSDIEVEDLGLMTTRHRVSLICPITQSLIAVPAKSAYCSHLTCFDLKAFLLMNERRLQWTCPLCKKSASFESLRVDERLKSIISNVPPNCSTVEIDSTTDCQYILDCVKQEKVDVTHAELVEQINDDDGPAKDFSTKPRSQSDESDCIVLSSGSESEDDDNNNDDDDDDDGINDPSLPATSILLRNDNLDDGPINTVNDIVSRSSRSTTSPILSTIDDNDYWENIAQITYDLSSDGSYKFPNRKRSNSSTSSVLSSASSKSPDVHHHKKKNKHQSSVKSPSNEIEIITLSSSDSSDNDDHSS